MRDKNIRNFQKGTIHDGGPGSRESKVQREREREKREKREEERESFMRNYP